MQQVLIHPKFPEKAHLPSVISDIDKLYIDELDKASSSFSNLKSNLDKLDADKLLPVPVDSSKLSDSVINEKR